MRLGRQPISRRPIPATGWIYTFSARFDTACFSGERRLLWTFKTFRAVGALWSFRAIRPAVTVTARFVAVRTIAAILTIETVWPI